VKAFGSSLAIRSTLARTHPDNAQWQRDVALSYIQIADVLIERGDPKDALESYQHGAAVLERLVQANKAPMAWQGELWTWLGKIGDMKAAQGDLPEAQRSYGARVEIAYRLAANDDPEWRRKLAVSYDNMGDTQRKRGDLAGALKSYQAAHAIFVELAKADSGNLS